MRTFNILQVEDPLSEVVSGERLDAAKMSRKPMLKSPVEGKSPSCCLDSRLCIGIQGLKMRGLSPKNIEKSIEKATALKFVSHQTLKFLWPLSSHLVYCHVSM